MLGEDGLHEVVPGLGEGSGRNFESVFVRFVGMVGNGIVPLVRGKIVAPEYQLCIDHICEAAFRLVSEIASCDFVVRVKKNAAVQKVCKQTVSAVG
jgi:hypothetical protein